MSRAESWTSTRVALICLVGAKSYNGRDGLREEELQDLATWLQILPGEYKEGVSGLIAGGYVSAEYDPGQRDTVFRITFEGHRVAPDWMGMLEGYCHEKEEKD